MEGEALKAWRLDAGKDQASAAAYLGISRSALASYESGRRAVPPNVAAKITGGPTFAVENKPEAALRKLDAAPPVEKAKAAAATVKAAAGASGIRAEALATGIPLKWAKALERRNARRVTKAEAAADPMNCAGPNVWTWTDAQGPVFIKFSASGQGSPSMRRPGDPGFIPNVFKDGGGSPKAPPPAVKRKAA